MLLYLRISVPNSAVIPLHDFTLDSGPGLLKANPGNTIEMPGGLLLGHGRAGQVIQDPLA